ncbi:hypothetical protein BCR37DRAFT_384874 [Protomyces lactucae-debilis]|uniref:Uncharacterized protein n=1 Tax=Protomyces lactucae-debilis TaxID=2754530 RepID=A0A1Y2FU57_PROLT|nr:uncharacterized protein BCR37DRAFT_384874 [Protomyces lactucae-debilis]ORY87543.1 hypothetical protein BCR37DRAFT_384874 [Protomyces lactucae-debilis]
MAQALQFFILLALIVHVCLAQNCSVPWFHLQKGILTRPATEVSKYSPCVKACIKHFFSDYKDALSATADPCFITGDRRVSNFDALLFNIKAANTGNPSGQLGNGYLQHCTCTTDIVIRRVRTSTRLLDCSLKAIADRLSFAYTLVSTSQMGYLVENLPCTSDEKFALGPGVTLTSYFTGKVYEVEDNFNFGICFKDDFSLGYDLQNEGIIYLYDGPGYGPGGFM